MGGECPDVQLGCVVQAYRRTPSPISATSSRGRRPRCAVPLRVRLVKGAYWDHEEIVAGAAGWPCRCSRSKAETDANYERCTRYLHRPRRRGPARVRQPQPAQPRPRHRLRARRCELADTAASSSRCSTAWPSRCTRAVRASACGCASTRRSASCVPGMAYLVRRLLENTSNESFVRHRFAEGRDARRAARAAGPVDEQLPAARRRRSRLATDPDAPPPFTNEPLAEFRRRRGASGASRAAVDAAGEPRASTSPPSSTAERVATDGDDRLGRSRARRPSSWPQSASCATRRGRRRGRRRRRGVAGVARARRGRRAGRGAVPRRRVMRAPARRAGRARGLRGAASRGARPTPTSARRSTSASTTAARCSGSAPAAPSQSPPGEANAYSLPATRRRRRDRAVELPARHPDRHGHRRAGHRQRRAPQAGRADAGDRARAGRGPARRRASRPACSRFLPGIGEEVGAHLVEHPTSRSSSFTGSKAVGLRHHRARRRRAAGPAPRQAGHRRDGRQERRSSSTPTPTSTGGPRVVHSAFGYAGQKCSACSRADRPRRGLDELRRPAGRRRRDRAASATRRACARVSGRSSTPTRTSGCGGTVDSARAEGDGRRSSATDVPDGGWFVGPTIVADVDPRRAIATDEIFGPVLAVLARRRLRRTPSRSPTAPTTPSPPASSRARRRSIARGDARAAGRQRLRQPRASPAPSSAASRSAASGSRASAPRPAAPTTSCSSSTRASSPRTPLRQGFAPPSTDQASTDQASTDQA